MTHHADMTPTMRNTDARRPFVSQGTPSASPRTLSTHHAAEEEEVGAEVLPHSRSQQRGHAAVQRTPSSVEIGNAAVEGGEAAVSVSPRIASAPPVRSLADNLSCHSGATPPAWVCPSLLPRLSLFPPLPRLSLGNTIAARTCEPSGPTERETALLPYRSPHSES